MRKKKIIVHKKVHLGETYYYFTKSANCFLFLNYKEKKDFIAYEGKKSFLGFRINELEYHTNNAIIIDNDCVEIPMSEVPESIKKILTFLR